MLYVLGELQGAYLPDNTSIQAETLTPDEVINLVRTNTASIPDFVNGRHELIKVMEHLHLTGNLVSTTYLDLQSFDSILLVESVMGEPVFKLLTIHEMTDENYIFMHQQARDHLFRLIIFADLHSKTHDRYDSCPFGDDCPIKRFHQTVELLSHVRLLSEDDKINERAPWLLYHIALPHSQQRLSPLREAKLLSLIILNKSDRIATMSRLFKIILGAMLPQFLLAGSLMYDKYYFGIIFFVTAFVAWSVSMKYAFPWLYCLAKGHNWDFLHNTFIGVLFCKHCGEIEMKPYPGEAESLRMNQFHTG